MKGNRRFKAVQGSNREKDWKIKLINKEGLKEKKRKGVQQEKLVDT